MEARDQIVLQKEIKAMQKMDIEALKTLGENSPIQDPGEIDSLEKSLDIESEADEMSADTAGSGDLSSGLDLGSGGGGDFDMGGGDLGGADLGGETPPGGTPSPEGEVGGGEPVPATEPPPT
jgi:hypothetical protein